MKRMRSKIAIAIATIGLIVPNMAMANGEIEVKTLNGIAHFDYGSRPMNLDGRVIVSLKYISELFDALTQYDTGTETMRIRTIGGGVVSFTVGSDEYIENGIVKKMDTEVIKIDEVVYIPLRYALEALGYDVGWSSKNNMAFISGEANKVQDYRSYTYGISGEDSYGEASYGSLSFRTKYDCGLQVLPGTQIKGSGSSLIEFYYSEEMDLNYEYTKILEDILGGQDIIDLQLVKECLEEGLSAKRNNLNYNFKLLPSGMRVLKIECDLSSTDIQGVKAIHKGKELEYKSMGAISCIDRSGEDVNIVYYIPLIESVEIVGGKIEKKRYDKIEFSGGKIIDYTDGGGIYVKHGIIYLELHEFNMLFNSNITVN